MKFVSDFFSLLLFFVVYLVGEQFPALALRYAEALLGGITRDGVIPPDQASILLAVAAAIIVFTIQIAWLLGTRRKVSVVQWLSFGILVVFGGAGIYFHNDTFIKWKPTVLEWALAFALWIGMVGFRKNLIRALMEPGGFELPDRVWHRMNQSWMAFFVLLGLLNLYVAFNFSRTTWVTFKSFGLTIFPVLFAIVQSFLISRYLDRVEASADADAQKDDGPTPESPAAVRIKEHA